jgi:hypothetical protein
VNLTNDRWFIGHESGRPREGPHHGALEQLAGPWVRNLARVGIGQLLLNVEPVAFAPDVRPELKSCADRLELAAARARNASSSRRPTNSGVQIVGSVRQHRLDGSPSITGEFLSHGSSPRFGNLNHGCLAESIVPSPILMVARKAEFTK